MNGLVTTSRLARTLDLPITLGQTELRRYKNIQLAHVPVIQGQMLVIRVLTLHILKLLTPSVTPSVTNSALGMCSVGVYYGSMLTAPLAYVRVNNAGSALLNPYVRHTFATPGIYTVVISNNTSNCDLSVCVTGAMKLYL